MKTLKLSIVSMMILLILSCNKDDARIDILGDSDIDENTTVRVKSVTYKYFDDYGIVHYKYDQENRLSQILTLDWSFDTGFEFSSTYISNLLWTSNSVTLNEANWSAAGGWRSSVVNFEDKKINSIDLTFRGPTPYNILNFEFPIRFDRSDVSGLLQQIDWETNMESELYLSFL